MCEGLPEAPERSEAEVSGKERVRLERVQRTDTGLIFLSTATPKGVDSLSFSVNIISLKEL